MTQDELNVLIEEARAIWRYGGRLFENVVQIEEARAIWRDLVAASGKDEKAFVFTDQTGEAGRFITEWEVTRQAAQEAGYDFPPLIEGMTVTITHDELGLEVEP